MKKLLALIILFTLSFSANAQMDGIYVFNAVGVSFAEHGKSYSKVEPVDLFIYWDTDKGLIEINSKELQKYTYSKFTKTETNEYARLRAIELIYKLNGIIKDDKILNINNENKVSIDNIYNHKSLDDFYENQL